MVIFNSVFEPMTEAESVAAFGYGNVIAHDSKSFYATIGDKFFDTILSLHYTVAENRNHWYPTDNATSAQGVLNAKLK